MRLARLVVAGLAFGVALGFIGSLVRPRTVHHAILAATIGVGVLDTRVGAGTGGALDGGVSFPSGSPSGFGAQDAGLPVLTSVAGAC